MEDDTVLPFLSEKAAEARFVTSVCSGALLLAAGLLDGYRAATHWAAHDALVALGVEAVRERVVIDRNRMTGDGVTAGIGFGLTLLVRLRGGKVAKAMQLGLEYDPAPPFSGGTPETADPEVVATFRAMIASMDNRTMGTVRRVRERRTACRRTRRLAASSRPKAGDGCVLRSRWRGRRCSRSSSSHHR